MIYIPLTKPSKHWTYNFVKDIGCEGIQLELHNDVVQWLSHNKIEYEIRDYVFPGPDPEINRGSSDYFYSIRVIDAGRVGIEFVNSQHATLFKLRWI